MALQIYNVLGRTKQPFEPLTEGHINMYVCGPTVYDPRAYRPCQNVCLVRCCGAIPCAYSGYDVLYVQNLTDVGHLLDVESGEDRILRKARQLQAKPMQICGDVHPQLLRRYGRAGCH